MGKVLWIGIVLTALGALALLAGSISYTSEETVFEVGSVEATAETQQSLNIPPAVGWVAMGAGGALLLIGVLKIVRGDLS